MHTTLRIDECGDTGQAGVDDPTAGLDRPQLGLGDVLHRLGAAAVGGVGRRGDHQGGGRAKVTLQEGDLPVGCLYLGGKRLRLLRIFLDRLALHLYPPALRFAPLETREIRVTFAERADIVEVRGFADGSYTATPCDRAGRPIDAPVPKQPDDQPYKVGQGGVSDPGTRRPDIREEIRREERERARREVRAEELARAAEKAEARVKAEAADKLEQLEGLEVVPVEGEPAPSPIREPVPAKTLWRRVWGL